MSEKELRLKILEAYMSLKFAYVILENPDKFRNPERVIGRLVRETYQILEEIVAGGNCD